jgi:hypothetical protein
MPRARLELAYGKAVGDFESPASTNSAIRAISRSSKIISIPITVYPIGDVALWLLGS